MMHLCEVLKYCKYNINVVIGDYILAFIREVNTCVCMKSN